MRLSKNLFVFVMLLCLLINGIFLTRAQSFNFGNNEFKDYIYFPEDSQIQGYDMYQNMVPTSSVLRGSDQKNNNPSIYNFDNSDFNNFKTTPIPGRQPYPSQPYPGQPYPDQPHAPGPRIPFPSDPFKFLGPQIPFGGCPGGGCSPGGNIPYIPFSPYTSPGNPFGFQGGCPGGVCPINPYPSPIPNYPYIPYQGGCPGGVCPNRLYETTSYSVSPLFPTVENSPQKNCEGGVCPFTTDSSLSPAKESLDKLKIYVPQEGFIEEIPSRISGETASPIYQYFGNTLILPDGTIFSGYLDYRFKDGKLTSFISLQEFIYTKGIWIDNVNFQRGVQPNIDKNNVFSNGNLYLSANGNSPIVQGEKGSYAVFSEDYFQIGSIGSAQLSAVFGNESLFKIKGNEYLSVFPNKDSLLIVSDGKLTGVGDEYSFVAGDKIITKKNGNIYLLRDPKRYNNYISPDMETEFLGSIGDKVLKADEKILFDKKQIVISNPDKKNSRPTVKYN